MLAVLAVAFQNRKYIRKVITQDSISGRPKETNPFLNAIF
jgi:hypothetical protein